MKVEARGKGVPVEWFTLELKPVPDDMTKMPVLSIENPYDKLRVCEAEIRQWRVCADDRRPLEEIIDWSDNHSRCSLDLWQLSGFSVDEMLKIAFSSGTTTDWYDWMLPKEGGAFTRYENWFDIPELQLFHRISHSWWLWNTHCKDNWNDMVAYYEAFKRFDFGVAGMRTRLDWSTYYNSHGYSQYTREYLDGEIGFMVYDAKDELALKIAVSPVGDRGLVINQVQLAKKKGNRWLFKLPKPVLAYAIERIAAAFPGFKLWLQDGKNKATNIKRDHERAHADAVRMWKDRPERLAEITPTPTEEVYERIERMYDAEVAGWHRDEPLEVFGRDGGRFRRLLPDVEVPCNAVSVSPTPSSTSSSSSAPVNTSLARAASRSKSSSRASRTGPKKTAARPLKKRQRASDSPVFAAAQSD